MQALSTVRLATFHPERRGMAGGCLDARPVLRLADHPSRAPPGGECHDVVTTESQESNVRPDPPRVYSQA
jgi:hypothetical protein